MTDLHAYIDESEDGDVFVLGGYMASAEAWAGFSSEWGYAVEHYLKGRPFKMSEAYYEWSEATLKERIGYFYDIIQRHAAYAFGIGVEKSVLRRVMDSIPEKKWSDPYYFCFHKLIMELAHHRRHLPKSDKISFTFDRGRVSKALVDNWGSFIADAPAEAKAWISGQPHFQDDATCLPLQAADMKSWWTLQGFKGRYGHPESPKPMMRHARPGILPVMSLHMDHHEYHLVHFRETYLLGLMQPHIRIEPDGIFINIGGARFGFMCSPIDPNKPASSEPTDRSADEQVQKELANKSDTKPEKQPASDDGALSQSDQDRKNSNN